MSTRCNIIAKTDNGYTGIYCHRDGYPSGVGKTLLKHYADQYKVNALLDLGDLSSLGDTVETCEAYGRDLNEHGTEPKSAASIQDLEPKIPAHDGHLYLFDGHSWTHNGTPLAEAVANDN